MSLRVLHVAPAASGGGTSGFIHRQIESMTDGHQNMGLVLFAGSFMLRRPHEMIRHLLALRRTIRDVRPDIIHAHWGSLLAAVAGISRIGTGVRFLITFRGSDINPVPSEPVPRSVIRVACSQLAALLADGIVCVSDELLSRLWAGKGRTWIVPDGTDLQVFRPMDRATCRRELGWEADERVVFFYEGGRPEVKRRDLAEQAVARVRELLGDCRLEVLGSNVPHRMVPVLMNASDCLVMTSDYEGSPNIVREALACRVPVVSVEVGDVVRWLQGISGTLVVPKDPAAIGDGIARLIREGVRPDAGPRVNEFSIESSRNAVLRVYEALAGN